MSASPSVSVAGAGVFGLATALCLAEAGCAVVVWNDGAESASQVAAGMLAPVFEAVLDAVAAPHFDLLLAARDLWPDLAAGAGVDLDCTGAVAVGPAPWLEAVAAHLSRLGISVQEVGATRLAGVSPGLSPAFDDGLMVTEDWRLDPLSALAGLRAAAMARGVVFRDQRLAAAPPGSMLVVATGAAMDLAPELARLSPIKGHLARVGGPAAGVVVRGEAGYAAPGARGMVFGATMEPGVRNPVVVPSRAQPVLDQGLTLFPALRLGYLVVPPDLVDVFAWRVFPMTSVNPESFPPEVVEKLKTYVYRLIDPRNGETFYVGKGQANRVFAHARADIQGDEHIIITLPGADKENRHIGYFSEFLA